MDRSSLRAAPGGGRAVGGARRTAARAFHGEPRAQPALVAAVAVAVSMTVLRATWIPVWRATEVPPMVARRTG